MASYSLLSATGRGPVVSGCPSAVAGRHLSQGLAPAVDAAIAGSAMTAVKAFAVRTNEYLPGVLSRRPPV